ncbi:ATP-binding protein [Veronia nyctiphanis]|nr:ATP-binding protein [Veronia nyctiphanis]
MPSLLSRVQKASDSSIDQATLNLALMKLSNLNNIEVKALNLVGSVDRASQEAQRTHPDLSRAIRLLYSVEYLQAKADVFKSVGNYFRTLKNTTEGQITLLQGESNRLHNHVSIALSLLFLCIVMSAIVLWTFFFRPVTNIQNAILKRTEGDEFEVKLEPSEQGALKDLADAQNKLLLELHRRFEFSQTLKHFSDKIRGISETQTISEEICHYLSHHFSLPLVNVFVCDNGRPICRASIGGQGNLPQLDEMPPLYKRVLQSQTIMRLRNDDRQFRIGLGSGELELHELIMLPLCVSEEPVGMIEMASIRSLTDSEIEWIEAVKDDMAIALQLAIAAEKHKEADKRTSEQLTLNRQIIDAIPNPVYYRDCDCKYIGVNNAFTDFLGLFYADVIDKKTSDLFDKSTSDLFDANERELLEYPGSQFYDIELPNAEGELRNLTVIEATYFSPNGEPMGVVGLFVDVTTQKRLERDLISAKDQANEASSAKGEFLANMSHEIRTPMNAILGMAQLTLQTSMTKKQKHYVANIEKAGKSLLGIINDILDFSKIEAGKFEIESTPFSLDEVLDNVCNIVVLKAKEKGLDLLVDVDPLVPDSLIGDPQRFGQIVVNLVGNAVKFTDKGHITIRLRVHSDRADDSIILLVEVEDTGIGMTENQLTKLFESFSQADGSISRQYGGTGLGLSISKGFVELMGGKIWAESTEGKGSTFSFTLELTRGSDAVEIQATSISTDLSG